MIKLVTSLEKIDEEGLDKIIADYISCCEERSIFPWNYYYLKYPVFHPGSYGKYYNEDAVENPYLFVVMQTQTRVSGSSYTPFLKEVGSDNLSKDAWGMRLVYQDRYIYSLNDSFVVKSNEDDTEITRIVIEQNENQIDLENRIFKLQEYLNLFG